MSKPKLNEIEKIVLGGSGPITATHTFYSRNELRRKLKALVRKACEGGQHMQFRVQTEKESWVEHYKRFEKEFGLKL